MDKEIQDKIFAKYPDMFGDKDKPMSETCMCWGLDVGAGWEHIIDHLCSQLDGLQKEYDIKVIFDQVKEKFGELRIYHHTELGSRWTTDVDGNSLLDGKPEIEYVSCGWRHYGKTMPAYDGVDRLVSEIITNAADFSSITCENCGMTGATPSKAGWIKTECDKCRNEKNEKAPKKEEASS